MVQDRIPPPPLVLPKLTVRDLLSAPDMLTLDLDPVCVGPGVSMVSEPRAVEVRLAHPGDVVRQRDELVAAIRDASQWNGSTLCWCRSDDAPYCDTPSCVRLRALLG